MNNQLSVVRKDNKPVKEFDENHYQNQIYNSPENYASFYCFLPNERLPLIFQECLIESELIGKIIVNDEKSSIVKSYVDYFIQQNFDEKNIWVTSPIPSHLESLRHKFKNYNSLQCVPAKNYKSVGQQQQQIIVILSIGLLGSCVGIPKMDQEQVNFLCFCNG